jgi:hypothetical protein
VCKLVTKVCAAAALTLWAIVVAARACVRACVRASGCLRPWLRGLAAALRAVLLAALLRGGAVGAGGRRRRGPAELPRTTPPNLLFPCRDPTCWHQRLTSCGMCVVVCVVVVVCVCVCVCVCASSAGRRRLGAGCRRRARRQPSPAWARDLLAHQHGRAGGQQPLRCAPPAPGTHAVTIATTIATTITQQLLIDP